MSVRTHCLASGRTIRVLEEFEAIRILKGVPELCGHLAALTLPTAQSNDDPTSFTPTEVRRLPLRGAPLDALDSLFRELHNSVSYWAELLEMPAWESLDYMVRRSERGDVLGPRLVVTEAHGIDTITLWAKTLTNRLETWWPEIVLRSEFPAWLQFADEWFGKPTVRWPLWDRDPVPQRPRECANCKAKDVFADPVVPNQALCGSCWKVFQPEVWMPIGEAADLVSRSIKTLEAWVYAERLVQEKRGGKRFVEIGAVRRLAKVMDEQVAEARSAGGKARARTRP
ncbi:MULTISPECIES: hypothetical protein [unclassified Pseudoclavibacter]|uniref:hypothetical protein n=1 Tax=unclassified Pseudoclavibacter TaxID=2615177 RepID=UPI001BA6C0AD|nr:hypothetical protein [Pseudoclavibacter sp. Marseille-Q4354]MBS3177738.1 hypothetical protein [Pseudoclavibacter sp. Marseille-Q4354]